MPDEPSNRIMAVLSRDYWRSMSREQRLLWAVISSTITFCFIAMAWNVPLEKMSIRLATWLCLLGIAYYMRVKPSIRVNRVVYIITGGSWIGMALIVFLAFSGIGRWLTDTLGAAPSIIINLIIPWIAGALIGDWIGRKREYRFFKHQ